MHITGRSAFQKLYNFHDEHAAGRSYILIHMMLSTVASNLTGGLFGTRFLLMNGITLVGVGILSFVPYATSFFSLFGPRFFHHFPRRRWLLAALHLASTIIGLLGVTLLPSIVQSASARLAWFVVIRFISSIIVRIYQTGYAVWHIQFLPQEFRSDYFAIRDNLNNLIGVGITILIALFADAVSGTEYEYAVIVGIRYLALALTLIDIYILCKPKEYDYPTSVKLSRITDIFRIPLKNRHFTLTMTFTFLCYLINSLPGGVLNYHLLESIGVPYSYVYFIDICYSIFLAVFLPHWNRVLRKYGWFRTYAIGTLLLMPTYVMYALVTPGNYVWLFLLLRFIQHYFGVGRNVTFANFLYINLPEADRDDCVTFYNLGINTFQGIGVLLGVSIVSWIGDSSLTVFGYSFTAVPILLLIMGAGMILLPAVLMRILPLINPITPTESPSQG